MNLLSCFVVVVAGHHLLLLVNVPIVLVTLHILVIESAVGQFPFFPNPIPISVCSMNIFSIWKSNRLSQILQVG